jgi:hypothetical protein
VRKQTVRMLVIFSPLSLLLINAIIELVHFSFATSNEIKQGSQDWTTIAVFSGIIAASITVVGNGLFNYFVTFKKLEKETNHAIKNALTLFNNEKEYNDLKVKFELYPFLIYSLKKLKPKEDRLIKSPREIVVESINSQIEMKFNLLDNQFLTEWIDISEFYENISIKTFDNAEEIHKRIKKLIHDLELCYSLIKYEYNKRLKK